MRDKKGFTFIEVIVVVVLIAILALIAFPSYKNSKVVSENEMARAKLSELATAARMYNEEARGSERVAGGLGEAALTGFTNPKVLFARTLTSSGMDTAYLNGKDWTGFPSGCTTNCVYRFAGYSYYVCNPDGGSASSQPADSGCDNDRIATMKGPDTGAAASMYGGHTWWVSRTGNLGIIGSDFTGS